MFTIIHKSEPREAAAERIAKHVRRLPADKVWHVDFKEKKPKRSEQQNRYLWGVCYAELLKHLPGWDVDDVHTYMLGEHFGWEIIEGMGKKRMRPLKRSSGLNKQEFSDFVAFVQRKAAEHGVVIPDADLG